MAHHQERSDVAAEIRMLREQQFESEIDASYLGWTLRAKIANERRANRISLLIGVLDDLDTSGAAKAGTSRATY